MILSFLAFFSKPTKKTSVLLGVVAVHKRVKRKCLDSFHCWSLARLPRKQSYHANLRQENSDAIATEVMAFSSLVSSSTFDGGFFRVRGLLHKREDRHADANAMYNVTSVVL